MHQVLCTLSHEGSDVRCAVCGQGFLVYWSRFSRAEQAECRRLIQDQLRVHHELAKDPGADRRIHPRAAFNVPEWTSLPHFSATSMLSKDKSAPFEDVA